MTMTAERLRLLHGSAGPDRRDEAPCRAGRMTMPHRGVDLRYLRLGDTKDRTGCLCGGAQHQLGHRAGDRLGPRGGAGGTRASRRRLRRSPRTNARSISTGTARSPARESGRVEVVLDGRAEDMLP